MYKLRVSGKLNYFLNIAGLLQNGYHRLFTIMQSVDVYDTIAFSPGTGFSLICPGVPEEQNTAAKAARLFFERTGEEGTLSIHIEKGIPFCGGMGGSSADAAGVLMGLNALYGSPLPKEELYKLGRSLGSDVRFLMEGGCALCTGMGDQLRTTPNNLNAYYLILQPGNASLTAGEAYRLYDQIGGSRASHLPCQEALAAGDLSLLRPALQNSLRRACETAHPEIGETLLKLSSLSEAAFLTGSGSCCVGVFSSRAAAEYAFLAAGEGYAFKKVAEKTSASILFDEGF